MEFYVDSDGDVIKIDVVPGCELSQDKYKEDENFNLYVYHKYGNIDAGSERIKTNVKTQINNIKDNATVKKEPSPSEASLLYSSSAVLLLIPHELFCQRGNKPSSHPKG